MTHYQIAVGVSGPDFLEIPDTGNYYSTTPFYHIWATKGAKNILRYYTPEQDKHTLSHVISRSVTCIYGDIEHPSKKAYAISIHGFTL